MTLIRADTPTRVKLKLTQSLLTGVAPLVVGGETFTNVRNDIPAATVFSGQTGARVGFSGVGSSTLWPVDISWDEVLEQLYVLLLGTTGTVFMEIIPLQRNGVFGTATRFQLQSGAFPASRDDMKIGADNGTVVIVEGATGNAFVHDFTRHGTLAEQKTASRISGNWGSPTTGVVPLVVSGKMRAFERARGIQFLVHAANEAQARIEGATPLTYANGSQIDMLWQNITFEGNGLFVTQPLGFNPVPVAPATIDVSRVTRGRINGIGLVWKSEARLNFRYRGAPDTISVIQDTMDNHTDVLTCLSHAPPGADAEPEFPVVVLRGGTAFDGATRVFGPTGEVLRSTQSRTVVSFVVDEAPEDILTHRGDVVFSHDGLLYTMAGARKVGTEAMVADFLVAEI